MPNKGYVPDWTRPFVPIDPIKFGSHIFKAYIETQFQICLKILKTDCGTEFVNKRVDNLLSSHGIVHQSSCPYTQAQNGIAER